ncbi:MAG: PEP-CTERM sorting domain-containing protein [Burkholderiales bacterium]|jgi:hypothetical protein|nr:PEP-CTERM sorting domain-containing protein [Burkholderiales bacterium]
MIRRSLAVTLTALLVAALPARAAEIIQLKSFDASLGGPSSLAFTPFDPALGTLTSARVAMNGVMSVQALASPLAGTAPGAFVPYSFSILSSLDAISPGGFGFEFGNAASWLASLNTSGAGEPVGASSAFALDFEFGAASDFTGFASLGGVSGLTQPPVPIAGRRSDFIETIVSAALGIQQQFFLQPVPQVLGAPAPVTVTGVTFQGVIQLAYTYEPAAAVPEPGTLALLGMGLALLARRRATVSAG